MKPLFLKVATIVGVLFGLAACASQPPPPAPAPLYVSEPSYCYVSLADVECYGAPVPRQAYRLVGTRPTAD